MRRAIVIDPTHRFSWAHFENGGIESEAVNRHAAIRRSGLGGGPLNHDLPRCVADADVYDGAALQIDNRDIVGIFIGRKSGFAIRAAGNPVRPRADLDRLFHAVRLGIEDGEKARALNRCQAALTVGCEVSVMWRDAYRDFTDDFVAGRVDDDDRFDSGLSDI